MEEMVRVLKESEKDVKLLVFPGEGHGWRRASTIRESLEAELEFFSRVFGL